LLLIHFRQNIVKHHNQLLWDQWDTEKTIEKNLENRKKLVGY
jgi:hypothetical protein